MYRAITVLIVPTVELEYLTCVRAITAPNLPTVHLQFLPCAPCNNGTYSMCRATRVIIVCTVQ